MRSPRGFFLAERSLGRFSLTATLTATVIGGSATIAVGALIYTAGLPGLWLDIGGSVGLIVLGFTLAKLVRKTKLYTLPEITGYLFDDKTRSAAAFLVVLTQIAWISLLLQAAGAVFSVMLPLNYDLLLVVLTSIFIFYTFVGGQFAVVYTDIVQVIIMFIGVCGVAAPLVFMDAYPLLDQLPAEYLRFPVNSSIGILPMFSFFFMMMMPHLVGPDIYSKLLSANDEKTARYGAVLAGFFKFLFSIAISVIALSAVVLYPGLDNASFAIPQAVANLSPVLAGLVLASFVSVMLSSADTVLLSSGTILSVDITKTKNIIVTRVGIVLIGFLSLLLTLYMKNIINTLVLAYTVFTSGLTMPIIFGFYRKKTKATATGAFWSLVAGGSISLIWLGIDSPYLDAVLVGLTASIIPLLIFRKK
jgi:SSS family solute:Na+ symporter